MPVWIWFAFLFVYTTVAHLVTFDVDVPGATISVHDVSGVWMGRLQQEQGLQQMRDYLHWST